MCNCHGSGGTTPLLLTTATRAVKAIVKVLNEVRAAKSSIIQIGGVHVEGPFIWKAKPGAQRSSLIRKPTRRMYKPLFEHSDVIKRMTLAAELPGAVALIDELRKRGISVSGGHSDAYEDDARVAFEHGMHSVTHPFNCMSSTRRRGMDA